MYAEVLIQYGAKVLDKTFTYKIPNNMIVNVGNKVKVPFVNNYIYGIVLKIKDSTEVEDVKEIIEVINPELMLNEELIDLGKYLSEITFCTLIKAYQTILPTSLKVKKIDSNYEKFNEYIELNATEDKIQEYISMHKKAKVQIEILNRLRNEKKIIKKEISSQYKILLEKNIIKITKERKYRLNNVNSKQKKYSLTEEQQNVVNSIKFNENNSYLLYGVTGSGKTIVYIDLIQKVIKNNKTAIILVPEISLTAQMVNRLYDTFG